MKGNVLVIGNSGVGKSTLINAVLGEEVAKTGYGIEGTTDKLEIYESKEINFRIIDSVGFEPTFFKKHKAINAVKKWSNGSAKDGNDNKQINIIRFCVDGTSRKLFVDTIKSLSAATSMWKSVPIIVTITKSYSISECKENIEMVKKAFAEQKKLEKNLRDIIPVVASGAVIGAIPVPFSDALLLSPIETGEIDTLARIYGIKNDEKSKSLFETIITVGTVGVVAKTMISALKAIPPVNIGASVINSITAAAIIFALGEGSIYVFEQIYLGNKTVNDIDWVRKIPESKLSSDFLEKVKKIAMEINDNSDNGNKEIGKIIAQLFKK